MTCWVFFFFSLSLYGTHTKEVGRGSKKREEIEINTTVLESKRSLCCRTYIEERSQWAGNVFFSGWGILYANSYRVVRKRLRERMGQERRQGNGWFDSKTWWMDGCREKGERDSRSRRAENEKATQGAPDDGRRLGYLFFDLKWEKNSDRRIALG